MPAFSAQEFKHGTSPPFNRQRPQDLLRDVRLLALVANTLFVGILWQFVFDEFAAGQFVVFFGLPVLAATAFLFALSLLRLLDLRQFGRSLLGENLAGVGLVVGGSVILLVHEPYGFKILMDEVVLLGTSMMMHFENAVLVPGRAHDLVGYFALLDGYLDKRPLFFPFLLTLLHKLLGYRPENAFVLNTLLTPVLLFLCYLLGKQFAGRKGGSLTVLLMVSLPLLAQNATGGSFELLNLVMICGVMLIAQRYISGPDTVSANCLIFGGLLLAQTRYESVLFVFPIGLLVLLGWIRRGRVIMGWSAVFAPLFLLQFPLQRKALAEKEGVWQLPEGVENPFDEAFFLDNYGHAARYLFDVGHQYSNSFLLSLLGIVGLVFLIVYGILRFPTLWRSRSPILVLFLFTIVVLGNTGLLLCYHWGQMDDPTVSRIALTLHLCFALAPPAILGSSNPSAAHWRVFLVVTAVFVCFVSIPTAGNHRYAQAFTPAAEMRIIREFFREHPTKNYLFFSESGLQAITHGVSGGAIVRANKYKESIEYHMRIGSFSNVFVFQLVHVDPDSGERVVIDEYKLDEAFEVETVVEERLVPLQLARIVRIVKVRLAHKTADIPVQESEASAEDSPFRRPEPPFSHQESEASSTVSR